VSSPAATVNERRALKHLMDLLKVEGISGQEAGVCEAVRKRLRAAGVPARAIIQDRAHRKLDPPGQVGNLIVKLPGTRRAPRLLFSAHVDTVPLVQGVKPVRRGKRIVPAGKTALGGDDRAGVACLVTMVETLLKRRLDHPPLTLAFTIAEEIGLQGSRGLRKSDLGRPAMGFNIDGSQPAHFTHGAVGAVHWQADIHGVAAHAGGSPEQGVSAIMIASLAIAELRATGWFGRIVKGQRRGTSNVGLIGGGRATNEVTAFTMVRGECRSHTPAFLQRIVTAYQQAFQRAARMVKSANGKVGRVVFERTGDYPSFRLPKNVPVAVRFRRIAKRIGLKPTPTVTDGGLDANRLVTMGIPTVTFGAGPHGAHSLDEYIDVQQYLDACRLAVALACEA